MPYSHFDIEALKSSLEQAALAGYIYQHQQHMLVLQEALNDDGSALNNFIQHEHTIWSTTFGEAMAVCCWYYTQQPRP